MFVKVKYLLKYINPCKIRQYHMFALSNIISLNKKSRRNKMKQITNEINNYIHRYIQQIRITIFEKKRL